MTDAALGAAAAARIKAAQEGLRAAGLDGWLLYDFQGRNPIFWQLLGQPRHVTRRLYLFVPREGEPRVLRHAIDAVAMRPFGIAETQYLTWQELGVALPKLIGGCRRIAMDYAPGCVLPVVSRADAGTVELVRSLGVEVVSSADLIQSAVARWSPADLADHEWAASELLASLDAAFLHLQATVDAGQTEHGLQAFLLEEFARRGIETEDPPVVAVNGHAGDPHYEPSASRPTAIRRGDWLLVDLWARLGPGRVYADSTWTAYLGEQAPAKHQKVFDVVIAARDAAIAAIKPGIEGWRVDRVARDVIAQAGYGDYFVHRTGHSLGRQVHGPGVNLDDYETHDTRTLIEGVAVTVEPGIYLPDLGVRSEVNVVMGAAGPRVTTRLQREITLL